MTSTAGLLARDHAPAGRGFFEFEVLLARLPEPYGEQAIAEQLPGDHTPAFERFVAARLNANGGWDPFAFVDFVEDAHFAPRMIPARALAWGAAVGVGAAVRSLRVSRLICSACSQRQENSSLSSARSRQVAWGMFPDLALRVGHDKNSTRGLRRVVVPEHL